MPSLEGVRGKLKRADNHLEALKAEVASVTAEFDADGLRKTTDPANGDYVWVVDINEHRTDTVAAMAGDFIHNLRGALDHLVWELADPDQRPRSEFPVFKNDGAGNSGFTGGGAPKISSLPEDARQAIEALQPFHAGDDAVSHPLWLIHDLDIIDKHRRLLTAPAAASRAGLIGPPFKLGGKGPLVMVELHDMKFTVGKCRNGDALVRIAGTNPPEMVAEFRPGVKFKLTLDEVGLPELFIEDQLSELGRYVVEDVVPLLAPFFEPE